MGVAFTREVSPRIVECELTHLDRQAIDPDRAVRQHAAYEQAIAAAGLQVVRLPDLPDHADAVFVEDTAIILGEHAIITRPGADTRRAEADSTAQALAEHFTVHRIGRGTIDGGDVLRIGRTIYVGQSRRTDCGGVVALANLAAPLGFEVIPVPIDACLHLKTAATYAGHDETGREVVLLNREWVDSAIFGGVEIIASSPREPFAANALRVGDRLIVAAGYPETSERLRACGFNLDEVDVSELEKAEAGLTCMSLIAEEI
jgi:dimethylargininase